MSRPLRLGPFLLTRPIGKGGMGQVWHAQHPEGVDVAVKVLLTKYATKESFLDSFRFEVRSVASLDHPGIVRVFDYGVVPREIAEDTSEQLTPGSPWLAMEYAWGGNLVDHGLPETWPALRDVLLQILDGLAHSHAHGIVHRDLKPRNVLFHGGEEARVALTDFGIAHALERISPSHAAAGTPSYMAPEQVRGDTAWMGPWTDLYALGCLAWRLVTGAPPYTGPKAKVVLSHVKEPVPELPPTQIDLPAGFDRWIRRLLEKKPTRRFQRAADAAHALVNLEWEHGQGELPPVPSSWRPSHPSTTERPKGTGLALFILRPWPLVGREREQDALWAALRSVATEGRCRGVVLTGAPGLGKSRLLRWLGQRADETGAARVLAARGTESGEPALVAATRTALGLRDQDPEDARRHLHTWLVEHGALRPADDARQWVALLYRDVRTLGGTPLTPLTSPRERRLAWIELIDRLAEERTLLLAIDDLHHDEEAFDVVQALLSSERRVLIASSVRPDEVHPSQREAFAAWLDHEDQTAVELEPLDDDVQRKLVSAGVGLIPRLADTLVERTRGNPLFAVRLVTDWARKGLLVPTSHGFALRQGARTRLPGSIADHFIARLGPLEARLPGATAALQVLACLGDQKVRSQEWAAACEEARVTLNDDIRDAIEADGLASPARSSKGERWSLEHALLRSSLMQLARREGAYVDLQRACARSLARSARPSARDRSAMHLVNAGDHKAALRTLEALVAEGQRRSQHRRVVPLLDLQDRCLDALDAEEEDPRRVRGLALRAWAQLALDASSEAHEAATRAWKLARATGSPALKALTSRILLEAEHKAGRLMPDLPLLDTAEAMQQAAHDHRGLSVVKRWRGEAYRLKGDFKRAERQFRDAWHHAREAGAALEEAKALAGLGEMLGHQGRFEDAEPRFREAQALYATLGNRNAVARLEAVLSNLARANGDPVQALKRARRARKELEKLRANTWYADLQVGLAHLVRGELRQARGALSNVTRRADASPQLALIAHGALLACAASARDWEAWDSHAEAWGGLASDTRSVEPDTAWPLEWAGRRAADAGELQRARGAFDMARHRWELLQDDEALARIDKRLAALDRR